MSKFTLQENSLGQLMIVRPDGQQTGPVHPVLAFPLTAPELGLGLVDEHGKEVMWLPDLTKLDPASSTLLKAHLARREYRPQIKAILRVSTFSTPSVWQVKTDTGVCEFLLQSEESIRNLGAGRLLLTHGNGMQFVIEDQAALDNRSKQLLARFMA